MERSLDEEIKFYNNLIKQNDLAFNKLSSFFKIMSVNGLKYIEKTEKALDDYNIELKKENCTATHIICLSNFYSGMKKYFDKMKTIFKNINNKCGDKILEFYMNYKNNIISVMNELIKLDNQFKDVKNKLKKNKTDYFNSSKNVEDQE